MSISPKVRNDCPLCLSNGTLRGVVLAEEESAYLLAPEPVNGCHLILPKDHYETLADLPDNWWKSVKALLPKVPGLPPDYNISINIGKDAGQNFGHLHFWVVPRQSGKPSSGKGLAKLIGEVDAASG